MYKKFVISTFVLLSTLCMRVHAQTQTPAQAPLKQYHTKYYDIYTDIDPDEEKEADVRMTRMAEEYHTRTRDFAGQIRDRLPFYLYRTAAEYYEAGGMKGSAGVFMSSGPGGKLMAIAGQKTSVQTWHVVQHEGFHQFAHMAIGGSMPVWLNEGLAEYFGESIFTGDGFVTGIIPPYRLSRLKTELNDAQLKTFDQIAHLSGKEWADQLNIRNYDQAWSMVHFMVHGDDGKFQAPLTNCIREISHNTSAEKAMRDTIAQSAGIEGRWKAWWLEQPEDPTAALYKRAAVATMESFAARAFLQKQTFKDFDEFRAAVDSKSLKISPADWLPPTLITDAFRLYGELPNWELKTGATKQPEVSITLDDGTRLMAYFTARDNRVDQVNVVNDDMASVLKKAQALVDEKKKDQAKTLVQNALKDNSRSAMAADAKKFLQTLH